MVELLYVAGSMQNPLSVAHLSCHAHHVLGRTHNSPGQLLDTACGVDGIRRPDDEHFVEGKGSENSGAETYWYLSATTVAALIYIYAQNSEGRAAECATTTESLLLMF